MIFDWQSGAFYHLQGYHLIDLPTNYPGTSTFVAPTAVGLVTATFTRLAPRATYEFKRPEGHYVHKKIKPTFS